MDGECRQAHAGDALEHRSLRHDALVVFDRGYVAGLEGDLVPCVRCPCRCHSGSVRVDNSLVSEVGFVALVAHVPYEIGP